MTQMYYSATGDFYYAKTTTTAGDTPVSAASKWQALAIPAALKMSVALLAAGAILAGEGLQGDGPALAAEGTARLAEAVNRAAREDGFARSLKVTDRG